MHYFGVAEYVRSTEGCQMFRGLRSSRPIIQRVLGSLAFSARVFDGESCLGYFIREHSLKWFVFPLAILLN